MCLSTRGCKVLNEGDVRELIALSALDDIVQDEDSAVVTALEDEDILVLGLLVVQDLVDLEVHGLTRPHAGLLGEPAIWAGKMMLANAYQALKGMSIAMRRN